MIAGLKPYAEMKDSGVEWLGAVPAHWDVRRLKYLLRERDTRSEKGEEQLLRVSQYTGITERKRDDGAEGPDTRAASLVGYKVVDRSDLAVNIMLAWNGSLGVSPYDGIVSPAYGVYRFNPGIEPMFFHHLLRSPTYKARIKTASRGVVESRLRLYTDDLYRIEALLPPIGEQTAIVRFLDHVDRRIRRAIAVKQKLIRLLEEQKRAIIHRAVTRGLDPDVRLKPSGVEWLGDVPEGWRIGRVKSELRNLNTKRVPLSSPERGKMTRRTYDYYGASGVIDKVDDYLFDDDLILIAEDGANLVLRNLPLAIIARGRFWVNNHAHILKPVSGSLEYFAALLECINYLPWITGAAQPKLTQDRLMSISIPVPPEGEQGEIAAWIETNTKSLRASAERVKREIELLREYRIRLVADVVTGKLDVREAAASLPEMTEPGDSEFDAVEEYEDDSTEDITAEDQAA